MKKHNKILNGPGFKIYACSLISVLGLSFYTLSSLAADEIDVDEIPNQFSNGTAADAVEVNENFEFLRSNMDLLVTLVQEQQNTIELLESGGGADPFEVSVDCAGGSFSDAVDPILDAAFPGAFNAPLIVSVSGTCTGSTTIDIDGVTIKSADPDTPAVFTGAIISQGNGNHLVLENLAFNIATAGGSAVVCTSKSSVSATGLSIQITGGFSGVWAVSEGSCEISNSTISGSGGAFRGVGASLGGFVMLRAVTVSGFNLGINPVENAHIWVGPSIDGTAFSQVSGNSTGVLAFANGKASLQGVDISDNTAQGIQLQPGGSALFSGNVASTIDNNPVGILMHSGAALYSYFGSAEPIVSNSDTGISCSSTNVVFGTGAPLDLSTGATNTVENDSCTDLP